MSNMNQPTTLAIEAWRHLTVAVARATQTDIHFLPGAQNGGVYINVGTGEAFDPVRDDGDSRRLAVQFCVELRPQSQMVTATVIGIEARPVHEQYDLHGCPLLAARVAVCRAILVHYDA